MTVWDDTFKFTVNYKESKYPKGAISYVKIKEYTSGKVHNVTRGGKVTIGEERVKIIVGVRNDGDIGGTIYMDVLVDGKSLGQKQTWLNAHSTTYEFWWDTELTEGRHTITVKAGH